jgi:5-methylcytosine-specific restriction endonuclease McrA
VPLSLADAACSGPRTVGAGTAAGPRGRAPTLCGVGARRVPGGAPPGCGAPGAWGLVPLPCPGGPTGCRVPGSLGRRGLVGGGARWPSEGVQDVLHGGQRGRSSRAGRARARGLEYCRRCRCGCWSDARASRLRLAARFRRRRRRRRRAESRSLIVVTRDSSAWRRLQRQTIARAAERAQACAICGLRIRYDARDRNADDAPSVDHIRSWRDYPDLRLDPANLRVVHQVCNRARGVGGGLPGMGNQSRRWGAPGPGGPLGRGG